MCVHVFLFLVRAPVTERVPSPTVPRPFSRATSHSLLLPEQIPSQDPLSPGWDMGGTVHGGWTARHGCQQALPDAHGGRRTSASQPEVCRSVTLADVYTRV